MATKRGYIKLLNSHGLRLRYNRKRKMSFATKTYFEGDKVATIGVMRFSKNCFDIYVKFNEAECLHSKFFIREANVLRTRLMKYGEVLMLIYDEKNDKLSC